MASFLAKAALLVAMLAAGTPAAGEVVPGTYELVAERCAANLSVKSPLGGVSAEIPFAAGQITVDENGTVSAADAVLDARAISTENRFVERQLKGRNGLHVDVHPRAHFRGRVGAIEGDRITVSGDLTLRDVTRPITLTGQVTRADARRLVMLLEGTIDRSDFGITAGRPVYSRMAALRLRLVARKPR